MKNLLVIAALLLSVAGFAQSNKEEVDFIQSIYGQGKKNIVADFIPLEGAKKDAFWVVYDEYEVERKELGHKRVALLEKYVDNYDNMDEPTMDEISKEMLALGQKNDKLVATYYEKIKKAAGVKPASQWLQIESYLLSVVRAYILEEIPFIGELEN